MRRTLLTLVDDGYEDLELWYPKLRLAEAGFAVQIAAKEMKNYAGKHGYPATAQARIDALRSHALLQWLTSTQQTKVSETIRDGLRTMPEQKNHHSSHVSSDAL